MNALNAAGAFRGINPHRTLPGWMLVAAADAADATDTADAGPRVGGAESAPTILVVEDDEMVRAIVVEALRDEGYAVLEASHGRAALDLLGRTGAGAVRLVLLDMRMPVMDGWAFAAAFRTLPGASAPIVVMTAAQDAETWGNEVAAAAVVGKPSELVSLLDTVARLAGDPGSPPPRLN